MINILEGGGTLLQGKNRQFHHYHHVEMQRNGCIMHYICIACV